VLCATRSSSRSAGRIEAAASGAPIFHPARQSGVR
jgi:hypothetical protein